MARLVQLRAFSTMRKTEINTWRTQKLVQMSSSRLRCDTHDREQGAMYRPDGCEREHGPGCPDLFQLRTFREVPGWRRRNSVGWYSYFPNLSFLKITDS